MSFFFQAGQAAGGICETAKTFQDGRKKTLNTGVVTFINYKKQVPSRISEVTFAHELGHNFGAKVRALGQLTVY
jgi:disintegrin and metalloproteinase domain-containing protein 10